MGSVKETQADRALLGLLADGQFHSGSALGLALGISRAAIWKRISRLSALGVQVDSVKGRGYRLPAPLSLLDATVLAEALAPHADFHYLLSTGSTNHDAMALPATIHRPQVVMAEHQNAGRGRRGRQWQSPFAANLYLSIRYPLSRGVAALGGLSLAVGVAVAEALQASVPGLPVSLKWPNDLLVQGAKLGGVLIEVVGEMDAATVVVVGIGLNVAMPVHAGEQVDQRWTDLRSHQDPLPSRTDLALQLLPALLRELDSFSRHGFAPVVSRFARLDGCRDCLVRVEASGQYSEGVARGVNETGALLLECAGEMVAVHGGEVSLRLS